MRLLVVVAVSSMVLASALSAQESGAKFNTSAPCSPAIGNVGGNVTITCFDSKVAEIFLGYINAQQKSYDEKVNEVQSWIARYNDLLDRIGSSGAFEKIRNEVTKALKSGEFDKAGKLQDEIIKNEEKNVDQLAKDYFNRAEMLVLQLKSKDALQYYAKAFQYRPYDPTIAEGYARALCDSNLIDRARSVYERSAAELRSLIEGGDQAYLPNLSCMLVNLGGIYFDSGDFPRARGAAVDALEYARRIRPLEGPIAIESVADALTGKGISEIRLGDPDGGRQSLKDATELYKKLRTSTQNQVIAAQALALTASEDAEKEARLLSAFDLAVNLLASSAHNNRSIIARVADDQFTYYEQRRDVDKSRDVARKLESVIRLVPEAEAGSRLFLEAVVADMQARCFLQEGDLTKARQFARASLDRFQQVEGQLRTKESSLLAIALNTYGWVGMRDGEYKSATTSFQDSAKSNRYHDSPRSKQIKLDMLLSKLFVEPFYTAAGTLISSIDSMSDWESKSWTLIWKASESGFELPAESSAGSDPKESLSLLIISPKDLSSVDPIIRCRASFFAIEKAMAGGDQQEITRLTRLCTDVSRYNLYAWIIRARQYSLQR